MLSHPVPVLACFLLGVLTDVSSGVEVPEGDETCALQASVSQTWPWTVKETKLTDADVTPDVIFGSGNENGAWTLTQGRYLYEGKPRCVEVALRGKKRYNTPDNVFLNEGNVYGPFGVSGSEGCKCEMKNCFVMEFSMNSDCDATTASNSSSQHVGNLEYEMCIGAKSTDKKTCWDPIHDKRVPAMPFPTWDHYFGDALTKNGKGVSAGKLPNYALYAGFLATETVAQNSQSLTWLPGFADIGVGYQADAEFIISLKAFEPPCKWFGWRRVVAATEIRIVQNSATSCSP